MVQIKIEKYLLIDDRCDLTPHQRNKTKKNTKKNNNPQKKTTKPTPKKTNPKNKTKKFEEMRRLRRLRSRRGFLQIVDKLRNRAWK